MDLPKITYQPIPQAGVNIQIFNPVAGYNAVDREVPSTNYMTAPVYPANYYTSNFNPTQHSVNNVEVNNVQKKVEAKNIQNPQKVETKKLVEITDEYVKTLENYLNSQDVEKRVLAAKDILARVQEDSSRKDNLALTALVNKMLKDPYQPIKFLALGILRDRQITGNVETVNILQQIEKDRHSSDGNKDRDAVKASDVLLRMTRCEKEMQV